MWHPFKPSALVLSSGSGLDVLLAVLMLSLEEKKHDLIKYSR